MNTNDGQPIQPGACDICGCTRYRFHASLCFEGYPGPFRLWRCRRCGVVVNWPQLGSDAIRDQYDGAYYIFREPPARRWSRTTQLYLDHLQPLEGDMGGKRLLDVGCASGELLTLAKSRGWDAHGVELSPQAARTAREQHGLNVHVGTLEDQNGTLGTFDIIIATDVIEHVTSPRLFVEAIRERLRPGGRVVLETPNWGGRWRRFGGRRWLGYNRFHVFLFDERSLKTLMHRAGFSSYSTYTTTHTGYAHWGHRPELLWLADGLPEGLRWRAQRWLNWMTPVSQATKLQCQPPCSPEEAVEWIERCADTRVATNKSARSTGDNLTVSARV